MVKEEKSYLTSFRLKYHTMFYVLLAAMNKLSGSSVCTISQLPSTLTEN